MVPVLVSFLFLVLKLTSGQDAFSKCKQDGTLLSDSICLPSGYLARMPPPGRPVLDSWSVLDYVKEVNDEAMTLTSLFSFAMRWSDSRIIVKSSDPDPPRHEASDKHLTGKIWKPVFAHDNSMSSKGI